MQAKYEYIQRGTSHCPSYAQHTLYVTAHFGSAASVQHAQHFFVSKPFAVFTEDCEVPYFVVQSVQCTGYRPQDLTTVAAITAEATGSS